MTYRGGMTRTVPRRGNPPQTVHGITSARSSQTEDAAARTLRYLISMGIRTVCFVLVVVVPSPWRWFFAAGAVFLPYFAVIAANVGGGPRAAGPEQVGTTRLELTNGLPPAAADRIVVVDDPHSDPPIEPRRS